MAEGEDAIEPELQVLLDESGIELGAERLHDVLAHKRAASWQDRFQLAWATVLEAPAEFSFRSAFNNMFCMDWRYLIFYDLARGFRRVHADFAIPTRAAEPHWGDAARGAVIVTVHTRMSYAIMRLLKNHGLAGASIATQGVPSDWLDIYDLGVHPVLIPNDRDCLIRSRDFLRRGGAVTHHVDFALFNRYGAGSRTYISPVAFAFAARLRAPLIFCLPWIEPNASVLMRSQRLDPGYEPEAAAEAFLAFLRANAPSGEWSIRDWIEATGRGRIRNE